MYLLHRSRFYKRCATIVGILGATWFVFSTIAFAMDPNVQTNKRVRASGFITTETDAQPCYSCEPQHTLEGISGMYMLDVKTNKRFRKGQEALDKIPICWEAVHRYQLDKGGQLPDEIIDRMCARRVEMTYSTSPYFKKANIIAVVGISPPRSSHATAPR